METINIKDFILDKYTTINTSEQKLNIVFESETQFPTNEHGQEKCKQLLFPFSRSTLLKVDIKHSTILLDSKEDSIHTKEIREIILNLKNTKEIKWQPGDTIAILPSNAKDIVNELLQLLNLENKADAKCSVNISNTCKKKSVKIPTYIPTITTPREILQDCLNIKCILKKQFLRNLAEYCLQNEEQAFLKCLSSKEGSAFYDELILAKKITLIDILKHCHTCKPPLSVIVEHLPRLLPRPYSIANSPFHSDNEIKIIFSALNRNPGVTTNMLKEKSVKGSASLIMYLREPNNFRYTEECYENSQILIAVGTGIAPFLGFLQHKEHMMNKVNNLRPGDTWLFVGASNRQSVIYREQLLQWQSNNILNKFVESYSRDATACYRHVQDSLEGNAQELVEFIMKPETIIYLCADGGQISRSIQKSLQDILAKELALNEVESVEMFRDFKAKRKYREDIWV